MTYTAGLRERALKAALNSKASTSKAQTVGANLEESFADLQVPLEAAKRTELPWLMVGAILRSLRAASVVAAQQYAQQARKALTEAGVPAFNADIIGEKLERMVKSETKQERQRLYEEVVEAIVDSARRMDMASEKQEKEKKWAFGFGVAFCIVLTYAALRQGASIDERQFWLLRVVAAVMAAGVAAMVPGFISINVKLGTRFFIRAGGALAVFVIIYQLNPPDLVHPPSSSPAAPATTQPNATSPTPHGTTP